MHTKVIYKITNTVNQKVYIGQSNRPRIRWYQHKAESKREEPSMVINKAMKKYGIENFKFEVITSIVPVVDEVEYCKIADEVEAQLIEQEQSHISLGKGYNVSKGGNTSPKTEEQKQALRNWHANLSEYEKNIRSQTARNTIKRSHPAFGKKWKTGKPSWMTGKHPTPEAKEKYRRTRLGKKTKLKWGDKSIYGKHPLTGFTYSIINGKRIYKKNDKLDFEKMQQMRNNKIKIKEIAIYFNCCERMVYTKTTKLTRIKKVCIIKDCQNKHKAKGFCAVHYARQKKE